MVTFSGTQKANILTAINDIKNPFKEVNDGAFKMNSNTDEMYFWDIGGSPLTGTSVPPASLKPFKPENTQLLKDYVFWNNLIEIDLKSEINTANIDILNSVYQNFLAGINQMIGWCDMVISAYLTKDLPCYQNYTEIQKTAGELYPDTALGTNRENWVARVDKIVLDPTDRLQDTSRLCKKWTLLQGMKQVFFNVSPYAEKVELIKIKLGVILGELGLPTPEQNNPITPIQIDSTGSRQLIQAILDFQVNVTTTFKQLFGLVEKIYGHVSFTLLYLREDVKPDLKTIIQNTEFIIGGNPDDTELTSLNEISYVWLQGSDGNYYPIPPVESTDLDNDVPLSRTNGILAGLKRADENARWRYRRVNDALFEIATNNNINKAFLEDLSPRIQIIETKVLEIQTKQLELEIKINEILTKVNTL